MVGGSGDILSTHINVVDYEIILDKLVLSFWYLYPLSIITFIIHWDVLQYRKLQTWHATIPPKSFLLHVFVLVKLNI